MRVLALEPFHGGSHKAFLDGWIAGSKHEWTVVGLPAYKWKWRMRHAAVTLAEQISQQMENGHSWNALVCSDMLNLAEFRGLVHPDVSRLPTIAYFHENQLTYPVREVKERDFHFAFTNFATALAADQVWFNSAFHRDSFLAALEELLRRMPDYRSLHRVDEIKMKSQVHPPGIDEMPLPPERREGPPRILWAARWEHDKNPETFFEALEIVRSRGLPFRISVVGEQFADSPAIFERARESFRDHIDRWGYQPSRTDYRQTLQDADIVVSTARHEFFGLSMVEAIAAGAYPLLPHRLSYPEILRMADDPKRKADYFYKEDASALASAIQRLVERVGQGTLWPSDRHAARNIVTRFFWNKLTPGMDGAIAALQAPFSK